MNGTTGSIHYRTDIAGMHNMIKKKTQKKCLSIGCIKGILIIDKDGTNM